MYLIYAEALAQNGQLDKAIDNVNVVRARVGLKGLKEADASKNWSDKQTVIDAVMKERAENLVSRRPVSSTWCVTVVPISSRNLCIVFVCIARRMVRIITTSGRESSKAMKVMRRAIQPTTDSRSSRFATWLVHLWTNWDSKWYLNAFPSTEINKGYGLTQNLGW